MNFTAAFFKGSYMKQKNLFLRGAMVCLHQLHDTLPFFGPGMDSLCSLVLKNCAEAGLNCLLVEYEAMFPYRGEHSRIACKDAFSRAEIERFKSEASACGIEIIPLVQTLGHVYHILSHKEYASLRESPEHIQQCCPSNPATLVLAKELIDDIMETHPESRYIHLGGDECRLLGVCPRCAEIAASDPAGKYRVYADYYRQLADYCISRGKKVILWHDIAVKVPEVLSEFSDDVIFHFWNYGDHCHGRLEESFALLNSKVPAKRIIGGAGIRGEAEKIQITKNLQFILFQNALKKLKKALHPFKKIYKSPVIVLQKTINKVLCAANKLPYLIKNVVIYKLNYKLLQMTL